MVHIHVGSAYIARQTSASARMAVDNGSFSYERDLDAGYCLDAVSDIPNGLTVYVDDGAGEPFVYQSYNFRGL